MSPDRLVYMANQIARALRSRPREEAIQATAEHISNYWEPRMRAQLFALMDGRAADFDELLVAARPQMRPIKPA